MATATEIAMATTARIKQQSIKRGSKRNGGDGDGDGDGDGNGDKTIKQQSTKRGHKRNGGNGNGDGNGDGNNEQWQQWWQHSVAACGRAQEQQQAECHR